MSKIKTQIARLEDDLDANTIYLHEQYHQLLKNSYTLPFVVTAAISSLLIGYMAGRHGKIKIKTVASLPFSVNRLLSAAELFLDIKKPR